MALKTTHSPAPPPPPRSPPAVARPSASAPSTPAGRAPERASSTFEAPRTTPVVLNPPTPSPKDGGRSAGTRAAAAQNAARIRQQQQTGSGSPVVDRARENRDRTIQEMREEKAGIKPEQRDGYPNRVVRWLDASAPNTASCANFVSATMRSLGLTDRQVASVINLRTELTESGFSTKAPTAGEDLKEFFKGVTPGSVVIMQTPLVKADGTVDGSTPDPNGHAVIFTGFNKNGEPMFIGANSVDEDGKVDPTGQQTITEVPLSAMQEWVGDQFAITAVYQPPPQGSTP